MSVMDFSIIHKNETNNHVYGRDVHRGAAAAATATAATAVYFSLPSRRGAARHFFVCILVLQRVANIK